MVPDPPPADARMLLDGELLRFSGNLDRRAAETLRADLFALLEKATHLVVDLTQLSLLSAAGVRLLSDAWSLAREQGASMRVVAAVGCPSYAVLEVLGLLGPDGDDPPGDGFRVHPVTGPGAGTD